KDRIYFPQDEMRKYRIDESQIAEGRTDGTWGLFMEFEIKRARNLLQSGAPLGLTLPGRIGLEMRTIIAGGERILQKLHKSRGDMFNQRPVLKPWDWAYMLYRAVSKRGVRNNIARKRQPPAAAVSITASCSCPNPGAKPSPRSTPSAAKSTTSPTSAPIFRLPAPSSTGGALRSIISIRVSRSIR